MGQIIRFMQKLICLLIRIYQYVISPWFAPCCRFEPSCSQYALLAIRHYGLGRGLWMACYRLFRCHPFSAGGYDPILPQSNKENH